ncbi:hypothetical protein GCM10009557_12230 [Virgisporangium ochraceum]|uniref:Uncharacterized protein n=1 Tax=Virgisporangium ochraceum TaxID=65505 RepID=A0A8J4EHW2_9ACTN|nr:hypothetical protein [Virgisporangium ochraceum]GIJ75414.1 hypothetical protein Voc01_103310 [Virgisporangium ochraceum]
MFDELLLWCSETGSGRLRGFRDTYDWLAHRGDPPPVSWATALANLQLLGHVEVDWDTGHWAVAPTTLAMMSNAGGLALIVGAHPRWLLSRLDHLDCDPDPALVDLAGSVYFHDRVPQRSGPSVRYVAIAEEAAARRLCDRLGISFGAWVADHMADMLPTLPQLLRQRPSLVGPAGVEPRRLQPDPTTGRLGWYPCEDDSGDGAYEYKRYGVPRYVFRRLGHGFVADKRAVVYAELARLRRHVIRFDPARRELVVPSRMQLPLPHGRCAVFKSGLLPRPSADLEIGGPRRSVESVRYANIDEPFARALAASLEQDLQTTVEDK